MSLVVIAVVLIWEAYRAPGTWKVFVFPILAAACFVLFVVGTRERHRMIREDVPERKDE